MVSCYGLVHYRPALIYTSILEAHTMTHQTQCGTLFKHTIYDVNWISGAVADENALLTKNSQKIVASTVVHHPSTKLFSNHIDVWHFAAVCEEKIVSYRWFTKVQVVFVASLGLVNFCVSRLGLVKIVVFASLGLVHF